MRHGPILEATSIWWTSIIDKIYGGPIHESMFAVLYGKFENEKKQDKIFWSSGAGIRATDFLIFPPIIWIFMKGKGDGIKSKQPSKVFSTLLNKSAENTSSPQLISLISNIQEEIQWTIN